MFRSTVLALVLAAATTPALAQPLSPYASAGEQQAAMSDGRVTSEQIVRAYLERIERIDRAGPKLNSVLALNPQAVADARRLDAERKTGRVRGPLHGVPVLIKDNIEMAGPLPTTAGSLALSANVTGRDAPLVAASATVRVMGPAVSCSAATKDADARKGDYLKALDRNALKGARIGVWHGFRGRSVHTDAVFDQALKVLEAQGATLVPLTGPDDATLAKIGELEGDTLRTEFKADLNTYLAATPAAVKSRTLADLIAFNAGEPRETPLFGQEIFEAAQAKPPITDPAYIEKRATARRMAREALDNMLVKNDLVAVVAPSNGPPSIVDPVNGSRFFGSPSSLPAVSGYPHLTVPAGYATGLPIGISFLGVAWSEPKLLAVGYAYEQASKARREPEFLPDLGARPEIARAYDPR